MRFLVRAMMAAVFVAAAFCVFVGESRGENPPAPPLRVAIVGLVHDHAGGFFGWGLHRKDIDIVGIFEPDEKLAARYAEHYGFDRSLLHTRLDEMLDKVHPTAVLTYTNTFDHRAVVETCARRGIHVMMEKPLAVSVEDARAIEKAAVAGKIHVLVNYETTWYPTTRDVFDRIHRGSIGEIRKIVAHDGHSGPKEIGASPEFLNWLTDPKLNGGGALFDFGCYGADLATWLLDGARPDSVTAVTQRIKPDIYPRVDDEATIILTYPKTQVILQASWNWPYGRKDLEIYGQTGSIVTVRKNDLILRGKGPTSEQATVAATQAPYDDSISFLRAVIAGEIKPDGPSSLATNMIVTEILDAARQSAATGKTVTLAVGK
jgi:predicted dehydrogenase